MKTSLPIAGEAKLVVYSCHCFDHGPEYRIFDDDDIQAAGGISGLVSEMMRDSYWFARLGIIDAVPDPSVWSHRDDAISVLPDPGPDAWLLGQRNPSLHCGALGHEVFKSLYDAVSSFLRGWTYEEEGSIMNAYAIKQIDISPSCVASIAGALTSVCRAYEIVKITAIRYWYDPSQITQWPSVDTTLAEFPLSVPVQFHWDSGEKIIATEILAMSSC